MCTFFENMTNKFYADIRKFNQPRLLFVESLYLFESNVKSAPRYLRVHEKQWASTMCKWYKEHQKSSIALHFLVLFILGSEINDKNEIASTTTMMATDLA